MPIFPLGSAGGGGGGVTSFKGRTGVVVPLSGDYLPVDLAFADINTETSAGNLKNGQVYNITGFPDLATGVPLYDLFFTAYYDTGNSLVVLSYNGQASFGTVGIPYQFDMEYDWYGASGILSIKDKNGNYIQGDSNCRSFPWGSTLIFGCTQSSNFTADFTLLGDVCEDCNFSGNFTWAAEAGRKYQGIDFSKGYMQYIALLNQTSINAPVITELINEFDLTPTTQYDATGAYRIEFSSGILTSLKSSVNIANPYLSGSTLPSVMGSACIKSTARVDIATWDTSIIAAVDDALINTLIEIKIYL